MFCRGKKKTQSHQRATAPQIKETLPPHQHSAKTACVTLPAHPHLPRPSHWCDMSACLTSTTCIFTTELLVQGRERIQRSCISWTRDKSRQNRPSWDSLSASVVRTPLSLCLSLSLSFSLVHLLRSTLSQWQTFVSLPPQRDALRSAKCVQIHSGWFRGVNFTQKAARFGTKTLIEWVSGN